MHFNRRKGFAENKTMSTSYQNAFHENNASQSSFTVPLFVRLAKFSKRRSITRVFLRYARFVRATEHLTHNLSYDMQNVIQPNVYRLKKCLIRALIHPHSQVLKRSCSRMETFLSSLRRAKRTLEVQMHMCTRRKSYERRLRPLASRSIQFNSCIPTKVSIEVANGFLGVHCYMHSNHITAVVSNCSRNALLIENLRLPFVETSHLPVLLPASNLVHRFLRRSPQIEVTFKRTTRSEHSHLVLSFRAVLIYRI